MVGADMESRIKKERARLKKVFADLPPEESAVCDGLIVQAARLRVLLDDAWADISVKGDVEMFTQSAEAPPYERLRPVAQLYNTRDKNYQTVIRQLMDRLPDGAKQSDDAEELMKFIRGGKQTR